MLLLESLYLTRRTLAAAPDSTALFSVTMAAEDSSLFSLTGGVPLAKQDFAACVLCSPLVNPLVDRY